MVEVVLYFVVCYVLISGVIVAFQIRRKKRFPLSAPVYFCLVLSPFMPYVQVAAQTTLYGNTFTPYVKQAIQKEDVGKGPILRLRVLKITPWETGIYVVQHSAGRAVPDGESGLCGYIYRFRDTASGWQYVDIDEVFDEAYCGTAADGNTFPPYGDTSL